MKKIAFHFHNDGVPGVDFSKVTEGNPGVGGTVFLAVLIPTLLARRNKIDPILLSNTDCLIPKSLKKEVCKDIYGALNYCRTHKDVYALVVDSKRINMEIISMYQDVNIILWANIPMSLKYLKEVAHMPNILRVVNVSKEQCDLYRDMNVFDKSTYIYNAFPVEGLMKYREKLLPTSKRKNYVVYVASIVPAKGFHLLAKAWPKVLKIVPDAELFVIGSGKLYDKHNRLGKWGVSTQDYEDVFMPFLLENGSIIPSVHFLGEMGIEKFDIISKCKVGIPNPSGATETFGYTAIEMQAMGCFVTTHICPGYIDTVYDKSQLYSNTSKLVDNIVSLLRKNDDNKSEEIFRWIVDSFGCDTIAKSWEHLLNSDMSKNVDVEAISDFDMNYHQKQLKEFIRKYAPSIIKDYLMPIEKICASLNVHSIKVKLLRLINVNNLTLLLFLSSI